ncbi:MAG: right-handed parallel beta-helix repeat-containing protein [Pirellulaceae bacterium]
MNQRHCCHLFVIPFALLCAGALHSADGPGLNLHLVPTGNDTHPGTADQPLATLAAAQRAARAAVGKKPVTVWLHAGTYYLPETLRFTAEDSGTAEAPVVYAAAPGEQPVISGGARLQLAWKPLRDGLFQASTPAGLAMDQLFVNGQRQHMARYPNYDPDARQFNGSAADAIAPERVARWSDPAGGYIHAMHAALWGDMHWRILGKKTDGTLDFEGGWQNNRPSSMHPEFRCVENIREELDTPGEWYHDAKKGTLYSFPPVSTDLKSVTVEVVRLRHLIEFNGSQAGPVKFITLRGLTFRHAARTFMDNREPLLRSDWTTYRGGAVMFDGAEDAAIEDCDFDQLGGNTVFINNYNRRIIVRGCLIRESGANGVALIGDPQAVRNPLFNYSETSEYATLDRTPGPQTDNYPADCLVEDCLITRSGRFEKQTAPVQIAMAQGITVRHCSIFDVPRAGINIGDGCWGGHVIEYCDVFDTVLETDDHGSFNSWGRDRYWKPQREPVEQEVAADPQLPFLDMVRQSVLRNNRWRCDHGWDVDLDDGSSHYAIYNNLFLSGGLKLREGYARIATNNIIVNNSLHPHVWYADSGDVFARNIVMGAYRPAIMNVARWGKQVDFNLFTTTDSDRTAFADQGCDPHSFVGDPLFVDPAQGDFRVRDGSPALKLGFVNFPMDQFGVRPPRLKAIARTPKIPPLNTGGATNVELEVHSKPKDTNREHQRAHQTMNRFTSLALIARLLVALPVRADEL